MNVEVWQDIVTFLAPFFDKNVPSKFNSIKETTDKLNSLKYEVRMKWEGLLEIKLTKF